MALVLLSASVKRCFVSRMRDFFLSFSVSTIFAEFFFGQHLIYQQVFGQKKNLATIFFGEKKFNQFAWPKKNVGQWKCWQKTICVKTKLANKNLGNFFLPKFKRFAQKMVARKKHAKKIVVKSLLAKQFICSVEFLIYFSSQSDIAAKPSQCKLHITTCSVYLQNLIKHKYQLCALETYKWGYIWLCSALYPCYLKCMVISISRRGQNMQKYKKVWKRKYIQK